MEPVQGMGAGHVESGSGGGATVAAVEAVSKFAGKCKGWLVFF